MIKGLKPIKYKDHRTYDFHRTFGTTTTIPREFNFDTSGVFPNQIADGSPNGCTSYAVNDVASTEDRTYYDDHEFTYRNTKWIEGVSGEVPVSLMDALKAATVYGVKKQTENEAEALNHRRGPYFIIKKNPDYFQGLISAMWQIQGGVSVGTAWLPEFEEIRSDGIIPFFMVPKDFQSGHCWEAVGVKIVNGEQRIIAKSWQGKGYGDGGYCYFSRKQINDLLGMSGAGAFAQTKAAPEDLKRVQMSIIEVIISYLQLWLSKIKPSGDFPPLRRAKLDIFCGAIRDYEGSSGDLNYRNNNPGNCRYSSVGYAPKYGQVGRDSRGFAIFKDYATGWLYLQNLVRSKIRQYPQWTIRDFFANYAPSSDNNNPDLYAQFVAKRLGVTVDYLIKNLLA